MKRPVSSGGMVGRFSWIFYLTGPLLALLIWQLISAVYDNPWVLPSPWSVMQIVIHPFRDILSSGSLFHHTLVSILRVAIAFVMAAAAGITVGIMIATLRWIRVLITPLLELLRPLCPIAWMPFAIAVFRMRTLPQLFGVNFSGTILDEVQTGMVFVIFWGAFFPIVINTADGIRGVRENYIILARSLGASRKDMIFRVYLPAALPMIVTGLRQGLGLCWFVIIAAEMLPGSNSGIGYLLFYASDLAAMNVVIACMIVIAFIGAMLNLIMVLSVKKYTAWYGKEV